MSAATPKTSPAQGHTPAPRSAFLGLTRVFNKLVLPLAGTRWMPLYGVLEHRGRRSGKLFRTPVVVRRTPHGFVVRDMIPGMTLESLQSRTEAKLHAS